MPKDHRAISLKGKRTEAALIGEADIVALTPNTLAFPNDGLTLKTSENREGQVTLNGKGTVLFEKSEIKEIDERLADFTKEWPQIRARNFLISGPINEFVKDFFMISDSHVPDAKSN